MHKPATRRQLWIVLGFSYFYMAVAAVSIVSRRNLEFMIYLATMAMILTAVLAVYRRAGLSASLLWCFSLWGLAHMAGGLIPIPASWHAPDVSSVVYNWRLIPGYLRFDQLVHAYGVGLVTWLVWQALARRVHGHDDRPLRPTFGILAVCAAAGMGFGALNEAIEFVASLNIADHNIGDYRNTGWDLVSNFVGAAIAATVIWILSHTRFRGEFDLPT